MISLKASIHAAFSPIIGYNNSMDLAVELARFNPDPALANWVTGTVQTLVDQAQKDTAEVRRQITLRDTELRTAQTKIQALTLELAHLRRMRFGVRNEALTLEQRDLFQETLASDLAAAEAELAKQQASAVPSESQVLRTPRSRAGRWLA